MKKLIYITVASAIFAAPAAAGGEAQTLQIRMHDPGCHSFYVAGKYLTTYSMKGPVAVRNLDEATLRFVGPGGTKLERVGKTLTLRQHGSYRITMLGQASDDNHLKLVVR